MVNTSRPMASGGQAPCGSLVRLAVKNSRSKAISTTAPGRTSHSGFFHWLRTM